jgi:hypothetical protein
MITGRIDENLEARIVLPVVVGDTATDVEFLLDTGFSGFLAVSVIAIVFSIMGGIKASKGELWPYPMSFVFFPLEPVGEPPSADVAVDVSPSADLPSDELGGEAYQEDRQYGDSAE